MAQYEAQHIAARALVISPNKQLAYGAALADLNLTHRPRIDGGAFATIGRSYFTDDELANKGHEYPTMRQVSMQETGLDLQLPVSDFLAGWLAAMMLGSVTTVGAASPYTHTFKALSSTRISPVTTIYMEDTAAVKTKYPDMAGVELTVSGGSSGPVMAQIKLVGTGRMTDVAMAAPPVAAVPTILMAADGDLLIGPQGAPVSVKDRLKEWSYKITRSIEPHRGPGSGLYAVQNNIESVRASLSFLIRAKETEAATEPRTLFLNDTIQEIQINVNSGAAAQLKAKFPACYVRTSPVADGKFVGWRVEVTEQDVLKLGANEIVELTALNSQATYLVGA